MHRADPAISGSFAHTAGAFLDLLLLRSCQRRAGGFLEHLLATVPYGGVAHAEDPDGAAGVGDDLHLEMPGGDGLSVAGPRVQRHRAVGRDQLECHGITEEAKDLGAGSHEEDAGAPAQLGEGRILGGEPPASPRGVGTRFSQRSFQDFEVGVRAVSGRCSAGWEHGRAKRHRLVGLTNEQRVTFGLGEQRDCDDSRAAFLVELAHGADEAQRGFAPVDDGDTLDLSCQAACRRRGERGRLHTAVTTSRSRG